MSILVSRDMIGVTQSVRRIVIILAAAITACTSPFGPSGDVQIRVANNSSLPFARVEVVFPEPETEVDYGSIGAHAVSQYVRVETAYRYAYVEVQVGGEVLKIQPIDYVGETPLGPGFYTYLLNVTVDGHLTLEFREDR